MQTVLDRFGRLDILVNNAGLMLLGPIVGADVEEWERMIAINQNGLLYMTNAALPHLLAAAEDALRGVADIVNISSIAGRQAWPNFGVYNMTKFGVNGFTEALRQEVTQKHVRVGVLEPGAVATELGLAQQRAPSATKSTPPTPRTSPSRCSRKTSPRASRTWSPGPAARQSPSSGPCPPIAGLSVGTSDNHAGPWCGVRSPGPVRSGSEETTCRCSRLSGARLCPTTHEVPPWMMSKRGDAGVPGRSRLRLTGPGR